MPTLSSKVLNVTNRAEQIYLWRSEGYKQQQPVAITVFHGGFYSLQMTIKYYFTLSQWLFTSLTYLICLKVTDLTLTDVRKNEYEKLIWKLGSFCIAFSSLSFSLFPIFTSKFVLKINWCWCWCIAKKFFETLPWYGR